MNLYIVLFLFLVNVSFGAKILTVAIIPSYSHQAVYYELWKELSLRGHEIVSITTNPVHDSKISNLTEIDISFAYDTLKNEHVKRTLICDFKRDFEIMAIISKNIFQLSEIQKLKNATFDLVIAEWIFPAVFGYSAYFNAPLIGISSMEILENLYYDIGNPVHPVVHTGFFLPFKTATNFLERLKAVQISLQMRYLHYSYIYPESNNIIRTYIDSNLPSVEEIIKNTSMIFVNSNFIINKPKSNLPNIIEFSGLHIRRYEPLPQDIQLFLDNATEGVIYFSLGSYLKSDMLSNKLKTIIFKSFHKIPYKVLMKFEEENIDVSKNILISKWCPQQSILAHKNVKVFITHGGLQSIEEAIRNRVPMIGLPIFLDQPRNVKSISSMGISIFVDKSTVTEDYFKQVIIEVAENSSYRDRISHLASLLEDKPMSSKETLVWWIEYVLRHKGAHHLRSPFLDIPWYQFLLIDVLGFVTFCTLIVIFTTVYLVKIILQFIILLPKEKNA